jgi:hypothetical protein
MEHNRQPSRTTRQCGRCGGRFIVDADGDRVCIACGRSPRPPRSARGADGELQQQLTSDGGFHRHVRLSPW